jgi:N-acetylglucosamine-6-sulfatase
MGTKRAGILVIVGAICALLVPATAAGRLRDQSPAAGRSKPNIVLILTDDQRWDTLWAMPIVQAELAARGMRFTNFFYANPLCCPSRASILTGTYSHTNGVYSNAGYEQFLTLEGSTVATWLHAAGYHTGLVGKYLNGYSSEDASHIPAGWDRWVAFTSPEYYDYQLSVDGTEVDFGSGGADYSTDVLRDYARQFIQDAPAGKPVFLYFAPKAPHGPATPAPRHAGIFDSYSPPRPPSYNEGDVSDKPQWVQLFKKLGQTGQLDLDEFARDQLESLRAVDEAVGAVLEALDGAGRTNTMVVFASDNGLMWGEHRIKQDKNVPYDESIRGPLVVRWDGVVPPGTTDDHLVQNVDLAQTWAAAAGVPAPGAEGRSLIALLRGSTPKFWRADVVSEHGGEDSRVAPPWCLVRTATAKYVRYPYSGEEELYDLAVDPFETTNQVFNPAYAAVLSALRSRFATLCSPEPPPDSG